MFKNNLEGLSRKAIMWSRISNFLFSPSLEDTIKKAEEHNEDCVDIVRMITFYCLDLSRFMPINDILNCRRVSKNWHSIFSSDFVWKTPYRNLVTVSVPDRTAVSKVHAAKRCSTFPPSMCLNPRHLRLARKDEIPEEKRICADYFRGYVNEKLRMFRNGEILRKKLPPFFRFSGTRRVRANGLFMRNKRERAAYVKLKRAEDKIACDMRRLASEARTKALVQDLEDVNRRYALYRDLTKISAP